jgi:predicted naringenin-chalcone synthase
MPAPEIHPDILAAPLKRRPGRSLAYITGFQAIPPRFITAQSDLLSWLAEAHARSGGLEKSSLEALFSRYAASAEQITCRGHELEDFCHRRWDAMRLFGPQGSDLKAKTRFFAERCQNLFETFYPPACRAPAGIVHVTCTGYASPSGAQRLVSSRGWGRQTEVIHAYHMGCYAAHPAVRIASGLTASSPLQNPSVDVVHTELCSLHLDPCVHEPAQLVIQSLFADGFIKYSVMNGGRKPLHAPAGFEVLAARDEIVPDSTGAMAWATGPLHFTMELSRDVPALLASALPRFVRLLFEEAGLDGTAGKKDAVFAVHPGGPRIIELSQKILSLEPEQVRHSRRVLQNHGNMSSATLPHIWQGILNDPSVPDDTIIVSLGAGPGLTLSGMVLRKRSLVSST